MDDILDEHVNKLTSFSDSEWRLKKEVLQSLMSYSISKEIKKIIKKEIRRCNEHIQNLHVNGSH